jgi:hypothetical protein
MPERWIAHTACGPANPCPQRAQPYQDVALWTCVLRQLAASIIPGKS